MIQIFPLILQRRPGDIVLAGVAAGGGGALRDRVQDPHPPLAVGAPPAVLRHATGSVNNFHRVFLGVGQLGRVDL